MSKKYFNYLGNSFNNCNINQKIEFLDFGGILIIFAIFISISCVFEIVNFLRKNTFDEIKIKKELFSKRNESYWEKNEKDEYSYFEKNINFNKIYSNLNLQMKSLLYF